MALSDKKNDKIQGIKIRLSNTTYHLEVTHYADDCTLFCLVWPIFQSSCTDKQIYRNMWLDIKY